MCVRMTDIVIIEVGIDKSFIFKSNHEATKYSIRFFKIHQLLVILHEYTVNKISKTLYPFNLKFITNICFFAIDHKKYISNINNISNEKRYF